MRSLTVRAGATALIVAAVLLAAAPAEARKECRTPAPPAAHAPEEGVETDDRWPHDTQYGWHHDSGDDDWVHQASNRWVHESGTDGDDDINGAWVHDTDYGWWAAVPGAAVKDAVSQEDLDGGDEGDCTVSRERNECVVLANQIARYRFQLALAEEREDMLWQASLLDTIDRLEARGERFSCPWVEPSLAEKIRVTLDAVVEAAVVAAEVYSQLYRLGLF